MYEFISIIKNLLILTINILISYAKKCSNFSSEDPVVADTKVLKHLPT